MARQFCIECGVNVPDLEDHIQESHSDPDLRRDGKPLADFIREKADGVSGADQDLPEDEKTAIPASDPLAELGVRMDAMKNVSVSTETGASLTAPEAKRVIEAVEALAGYRIDRASFIVNFLDWGIRNSFSEELTDSGGFQIVSDPTVKPMKTYYKIMVLHAHINEHFNLKGTGRQFTFRRFGRYLGRSIPSIVQSNPTLNQFYVQGSPMSNRLGVAPALFLSVTSIFEYIKPYQKWTREEKAAWGAHNASVVKVANTENAEFLPADLRPSPSQASTLADFGGNDFGRRTGLDESMKTYGKGASIFEKMMQDQGKRSFST